MKIPNSVGAALLVTGMLMATAYAEDAVMPVTAVYPSGPVVPERLLRISIHFRQPPGPRVAQQIQFRNEAGMSVDKVLLPDEIWSSDGLTLTRLLDPGRVKTGLIAHGEYGWAFKPGQIISLYLGEARIKQWRVSKGGCVLPEPAHWTIDGGRAGTREPLQIRLVGAIDWQSRHLIAIADANGRRVAGKVELLEGESRWQLTPQQAWKHGRYALMVHSRLENACGDEINEAFEHDFKQRLGSARAASSIEFMR